VELAIIYDANSSVFRLTTHHGSHHSVSGTANPMDIIMLISRYSDHRYEQDVYYMLGVEYTVISNSQVQT